MDSYLKFHENSWSPATVKTARSILTRYARYDTPEALWAALQPLGPYSRLTIWTRLIHYHYWRNPAYGQTFKDFTKKNRRLFKGAYKPERLDITFEEAREKLGLIPCERTRREAYRLLYGAQRWSDQACGDGLVLGKGGRVRPDYSSGPISGDRPSYGAVYRALKKVGLKPHSLRKLALTRLVDKGATAADLMRVAGWSSIGTAFAYLQAKDDNRLKEMMHDV